MLEMATKDLLHRSPDKKARLHRRVLGLTNYLATKARAQKNVEKP
jgi:hypothetical protein